MMFVHGMRHPVEVGRPSGLHSHKTLEIVYHPVGGGVVHHPGNREIHFEADSITIHAPGEPHDQVMKDSGDDMCVQLTTPQNCPTLPSSGLFIPRLNDSVVAAEIQSLSRGCTQISPVEQAILNLRGTAVLMNLLQIFVSQERTTDVESAQSHVSKAERFMRDRFASIRTLGEVCDHVGVSHDHLRHIFKRTRGKTLIRYLNEVRIERAKAMLVHSRLPMKEISTICGFRDEYYFSSVFRMITQTPPGQYRIKNR